MYLLLFLFKFKSYVLLCAFPLDCVEIIKEKASKQNFTMSVNKAAISTSATTTTTDVSTTATPFVDMAASCTSSMSQQSTTNPPLEKKCKGKCMERSIFVL